MSKWDITMRYSVDVSVNEIEADTRNDAIEKARKIANDKQYQNIYFEKIEFDGIVESKETK